MRWSNVWVIFGREVRDQLRDKRTLFMIVVLPILLYPALGIGVAQLAAAFEQRPKTVVVVGAENLPGAPALLVRGPDGTFSGFDPALFEPPTPEEAARLQVVALRAGSEWDRPEVQRAKLRGHEADVVVVIPRDVARLLREERAAEVPVAFDAADERSQLTHLRVEGVIGRWKDQIVSGRLRRDKKSDGYTEPVRTQAVNVATGAETGRSIWAKLFPFLLVMMALTGAFYPAVDLCAGEKERGTMETLLISPASRVEIVVGKFLTVMLASVATATLNLASMAVAGVQMARSLGAVGGAGGGRLDAVLRPPSPESIAWMFVVLIPLSALFAAVCVALAVLARSMKEGQYYMTPLYLVSMPLILATLSPGVELTPLTSIIPLTGASLLLKALIQGDYAEARRYAPIVLAPIAVCGVLALRWAVDQFRRESVLFRESERFELVPWLRHVVRDRGRPTSGQAVLCFAAIIAAAYFLSLSASGLAPAAQFVVGQAGVILPVPALMALLLTRRPAETLRLRPAPGRYLLLGVGLALALHPVATELGAWVEHAFPTPRATQAAVQAMVDGLGTDLGRLLLLIAVLPAVCEEVAFRGFILSGLEGDYRPWSAILLSAFLFGFLHAMLSVVGQLFNAAILGVVLGLLAVRSRSLLPGLAFHVVNNAATVLIGWLDAFRMGGPALRILFRAPKQALYQPPVVVVAAIASAALLAALIRGDRPADDRVPPTTAP